MQPTGVTWALWRSTALTIAGWLILYRFLLLP